MKPAGARPLTWNVLNWNMMSSSLRPNYDDAWILRRSEDVEGFERKPFNNSQLDNHESQYLRDKARIIFSAAFRRLQSKTQVLALGDSDFYRTRLTHSLEVAQIGTSIASHLRASSENGAEDFIPTTGLIEAICLVHDLGHPPYGHGGEYSLNKHMWESGGFEGNGQTLRIVCALGEFSANYGFDLTRRTLLGLIKYPAIHSTVADYEKLKLKNKGDSDSRLANFKPPKCIHDDEKQILEWVLAPFSDSDKLILTEIEPKPTAHRQTVRKSLDTSIMELADDIAYGVHDLEDAIALGMVTKRLWDEEVVEQIKQVEGSPISNQITDYTAKLFSGVDHKRKHGISKLVHNLVQNISLYDLGTGESELIRFNARLQSAPKQILNILKTFVFNHVIKQRQNQILEIKGQMIVDKLFEAILENPSRLLLTEEYELYKQTRSKRVICDYISGMTDVYAERLYGNLFLPRTGSVFDQF